MALPPIPSQSEIAASVYGTWRLLLGDKGGLSYFGAGEGAFWRSCWVLAAVLPLNLLIFLIQSAAVDAPLSFGQLVMVGLTVVIAWYGYALAAHYVLPSLDRSERYYDYMIPEFWSSLPTVVVQFVCIGLETADMLPGSLGKILTVGSFGAALWLRAQILRLSLDITYGAAVGLVIGSLVFNAVLAAILIPG
ncbi:hypothetical protein T8K17_02115 [Thalassobaculum sp. OXR-137]|uniref:hypothetical protein n=1 Tax=Thalassobaculum sp. OXR-137 TaxID=3100173 RepID=UPI002AC9EE81|nr:hypothetical protein [Thalassobaculum sp. OXR-137]WPZ34947.1 hypothetical protein T8K17_02115 [Thalassobaculum sp. OXR-137]